MSTQKVVFLINTLGPGGAERCLVESLSRLRNFGIEPLVTCLDASAPTLESEVSSLGFDIRYVAGNSWVAKLRRLKAVLASERPDLIHTALFQSDILGRLAGVGTSIPVLSSLVNTSYEKVRLLDPNVRRSRLEAARLLESWTAWGLTDHFHAVSTAVKESAIRRLGIRGERITVVHRGHDPARLGSPSPERRMRARYTFGIASGDELVVSVGRQEYQKGHRYLLKAARLLKKRRPRMKIWIAGRPGHASAMLEQLRVELGVEDSVRFLGHVHDVPELLAAADLFVFPSLYEGLGNAAIEAMALGLAVVASDVPALREVVEEGESGLLVPAISPEPMAEAIGTLLDDPDRAEAFGRRGREIFEERFTIQTYMPRITELYRRVATNGRG